MSANPDYLQRVNRAIDFIVAGLDQKIRLDDVAKVACFSPCHFHRVFRSLVGETLNAFVKRVRLERSLYLLSHRQNASLTDIALASGFSSSSDYSRSFKSRYGVPPSAFDVATFRASNRSDRFHSAKYHLQSINPDENTLGFAVSVIDVPEKSLAYIRVHDPYAGTKVLDAINRLMDWAEKHRVADGPWWGYSWDDPDVVPMEKCRYDVAVEIPPSLLPTAEVSAGTFPALKVAELPLSGPVDLEQSALDWLFDRWLPQSGFAPDNYPCFEAWNGRPLSTPPPNIDLRIQLPVVDASAPL